MLSNVEANEARHFAFSFYVRISKIALWNVKGCLFRATKEEIQTIYRARSGNAWAFYSRLWRLRRSRVNVITASECCVNKDKAKTKCRIHSWKRSNSLYTWHLRRDFVKTMEPAKTATKNLEIKLRQLRLTVSKTNQILDSPNREAIERHLKAMQTLISEADNCKRAVEIYKLSDEATNDAIKECNLAIDEKIETGDIEMARVKDWLSAKQKEKEVAAREEQMQFEVKLQINSN